MNYYLGDAIWAELLREAGLLMRELPNRDSLDENGSAMPCG